MNDEANQYTGYTAPTGFYIIFDKDGPKTAWVASTESIALPDHQ